MLLENILINTVELGFGQDGEQLPAEIEGLVMGRKYDNELEVPLFAPRQA